MSLPKARDFIAGDLSGTTYVFEKAGDEFPVHVHDDKTNHITIVALGAIRFTGHKRHDGKRAGAGVMVDWVAGEPHGFVAEIDGTIIINIRKRRA